VYLAGLRIPDEDVRELITLVDEPTRSFLEKALGLDSEVVALAVEDRERILWALRLYDVKGHATRVLSMSEPPAPEPTPPTPPAEPTAESVIDPSTPPAPLNVGDDARKAALDQMIASYAQLGYRVESRSEFQATLVKGHRLLAIFGDRTQVVTINPDGSSSVVKGR